jgi:hypothetical protein
MRVGPNFAAPLTWPDRARLALLAGTLPIGRLSGTRLIVTPATILCGHRDIVRCRSARRSRRGRSGRPALSRGVRACRASGVALSRCLQWSLARSRRYCLEWSASIDRQQSCSSVTGLMSARVVDG